MIASATDLERIGRMAARTLAALQAARAGSVSPQGRAELTREALPYLESVLAGTLLHINPGGGRLERDLLRLAHANLPEARLAAGDLLLAGSHARIVLAAVPSLPHELSGWPSLVGGYRDLPAPDDASDQLERITELSRVLTGLSAGLGLGHGLAARRTYAYFETAAWLRLGLVAG